MTIAMAEAPNRRFSIGLARAFGGATIFSVPMFMTMEMWELGFAMDRLRLALLLALNLPLLVGLSHYMGFEETFDWKDDVIDAFVAYAVGFLAAAVVLILLGAIQPGMSADEIVGRIALQAIPGSIGAMLAQNQLGRSNLAEHASPRSSYAGEIFLSGVGALFLSFSVAPTEEVELIAYKMTPWHGVVLALASLAMMHAFVYAVHFRGEEEYRPPSSGFWSVFVRFTVVGYAVALLISVYVLWIFGFTDGLSAEALVMTTVVLGLPGAVGAAAARLIL